jgi:hypothetical protein
VAAAFGLAMLMSLSARGDTVADGRRHAQRASHLAAQGKCRQAVAEYDKAIPVLRDPALLFNRGECHRKLGNVEAALHDYDQFLKELPAAPNRAEIESHIAELKKVPPPVASAPPAGTVPGLASPRNDSAVGGVTANRAAEESATLIGPAATPGAMRPPRVAEAPAGSAGVAADTAGAGSAGATAREGGPASSLLSNHEPRPSSLPSVPVDSNTSSSGSSSAAAPRPWLWIAIGAVAVGVGTFLVLGRHDTTIPRSDLGNYKF